MTPVARVEAFVSAWHAAWSAAKDAMGDDVDFDHWRKRVGEVDVAHFDAGCASGTAGSFGTPPEHDPAHERVSHVDVDGEHAVVETTSGADAMAPYHEYELVRRGDDWRIMRVTSHFKGRDEPLVPADEQAAILAAATVDAPFLPLPDDVEPNGDRLFEAGRAVTVHGETSSIEVERAGVLHLDSGAIGVCDFGYDPYGFEALARKVTPGAYPVEIARAFGRVAAVRVVLSTQPVAAWHPAHAPSGGHVVGVDAGNVAVFDAAAYVAMNARRRERIFVDACPTAERQASFASLAHHDDCVIVESGLGDGGYPMYFGVDASGAPAVLLVDFMLLGEEHGAGYRN